jgi:hypothetical protein
MTDQQRKQLVAHESSHACIRLVLGGAVAYATIVGDPHVRPKGVLAARDEHVVTLAGSAAEFLIYPDESKVGHYGGDDLERAALWSEEERREAATRAKQLVKDSRRAILKVAALLEQHGTVLGERVKEAIR